MFHFVHQRNMNCTNLLKFSNNFEPFPESFCPLFFINILSQFNITLLSSVLLSCCHVHTIDDFLDYGTLFHVRYFSHFGLRIQQLRSTPFKGHHFGAKTSQTIWYGSTPFISGSGFSDPDRPSICTIYYYSYNSIYKNICWFY